MFASFSPLIVWQYNHDITFYQDRVGGHLSMIHLNFSQSRKQRKKGTGTNFLPTFHILVVQEQLQENILLPFSWQSEFTQAHASKMNLANKLTCPDTRTPQAHQLGFQYTTDYTMSTTSVLNGSRDYRDREKTLKWASLLLQEKKAYQDLAVQTVYLIHHNVSLCSALHVLGE